MEDHYVEQAKRRNILVDFNMLFDTDLGVLYYLMDRYPRSKFFKPYLFQDNIFFFKYASITRKEVNPICILLNKDYKSSADNLYKELLDKRWVNVIKFSPRTDILKMIYYGYKKSGYRIYINCRNEYEKKHIEIVAKNTNWITKINEEDVSDYGCLYIHDLNELNNMKNVICKTIYVFDYALNYLDFDMENKAINPTVVKYADSVEFKFISPYADFRLPEG